MLTEQIIHKIIYTPPPRKHLENIMKDVEQAWKEKGQRPHEVYLDRETYFELKREVLSMPDLWRYGMVPAEMGPGWFVAFGVKFVQDAK